MVGPYVVNEPDTIRVPKLNRDHQNNGNHRDGVQPVVDGSIPPVFLQNSDGSLILAPA